MTGSPATDIQTDAALVAYLDGELGAAERSALEARLAAEPRLKARLDLLAAGGLASTEEFDLLLAAAPTERLSAALAGVEATHTAGQARSSGGPWRMLAAAAILAVAGGLAGFLVARFVPPPPAAIVEAEAPNWRAVVAEYLTLYTRDTLAVIPDDGALRANELAEVGNRLSLALTPQKVSLPDLALKRAQLFQFNGMPLAQIAYLSADDGPVAFCIIANGKPDAPAAFEERLGQNIVFWTKDGRGYMIIGKVPRATLEGLAATLDSRVS